MAIKRLQGEWERRNGYYYEFDTDSDPLGEGGMGVVYLGYCVSRHSEPRRYVAIKQLRDDLSQEGYQRAVREASIRIRHENLVEMLGFITSTEADPYDGQVTRHYVISEFLYGILLSDVLLGKFRDSKGNDIPFVQSLCQKLTADKVNAAALIIRSVLSGIQTLHDKGFIHRDIDPSNIMVTASGQIKLIDFGIAKEVNTLGTSDRLVTVFGEFVGKPEYAAPELVLGDINSQNYHTDLYAVGILLYQLLAGQLPFTGSRYEVFQKQLKTTLPVKMLPVSCSLKDVVRKATEKDTSKRYSSAAEFRVDFDRAVKKLDPVPVRKWIIATVAAICCLTTAIVLWEMIKPEPVDPVVVADRGFRTVSHSDEFMEASSLYGSTDPAGIAEGYRRLKDLADKAAYLPAQKLLAPVFFPAEDRLSEDKARELSEKRQAIGMAEIETKDACAIVVSYLNSSADDALSCYMLGYCYWRLGQMEEGAEALKKAESLYAVSGSTDVSYEEIRNRLRLCQNN